MSNRIPTALPTEDLDHILAHTKSLWDEFAGKRIFLTGGTGFFGIWLLETIIAANDKLSAAITVTVLSRAPERFLKRFPHLAGRKEFAWLRGHPATFSFPAEPFDFLLHLATFTSAHGDETDPVETLKMKIASILHVLDFARYAKVKRMLMTSSGAVYGSPPPDMRHIPEAYSGAPDPLQAASAYGNGKRLVEQMCSLASDVETVIARCFAFLGPHLPLNARFAAGNFLCDALVGGPIVVRGDGRAVRSYLYSADMVIWLLTLLLRGEAGRAYNVGSDEAISIHQLAKQIARCSGNPCEVEIRQSTTASAPSIYLPDIARARHELGLEVLIPLELALTRTWTTLIALSPLGANIGLPGENRALHG